MGKGDNRKADEVRDVSVTLKYESVTVVDKNFAYIMYGNTKGQTYFYNV